MDLPAIEDMSVIAELPDEDIQGSNELGKRKRDQTNPSDALSAAGPSKKNYEADSEDDDLVEFANKLKSWASFNKEQKIALLLHVRSFVKPE